MRECYVRMVRNLVVVVAIAWSARAIAEPRDFTPEVRALYAVAACGAPAPAGYDTKVVEAHCKSVATAVAAWKTKWRTPAAPFFVELLKSGYPSSVVYPFGGGDLLTALAVYPNATDYTTLSLEGMGDPRPITGLVAPKPLAAALAKLGTLFDMNLSWAWNTTIQLSIDSSETTHALPGILALTLVALDANGYEPIAARFFKLAPDGKIVYLAQADVDAWDTGKHDASRKATNSVQRGELTDIEIYFRAKSDAKAPVKVFRHIAADLSDDALAKDRSALAYLETKHDIAAITK
ncbi:MAG TPA: hypothetical protein VGO00_26850, partial [Kofleriaceae bacterium]|nr:hypothetical protein [Kofleriaceae bacterium]